jgi:hypothetical protein
MSEVKMVVRGETPVVPVVTSSRKRRGEVVSPVAAARKKRKPEPVYQTCENLEEEFDVNDNEGPCSYEAHHLGMYFTSLST